MKLTKQKALDYLSYKDDTDQFYIFDLPLSKKNRNLAQNSSFYRCFNEIGKHMWISSDEVKQNCLKALFWVRESKFAGVIYQNAIKPSTSDLNIEEATLLIETLVELWKKLWLWVLIEKRHIRELFNNQ